MSAVCSAIAGRIGTQVAEAVLRGARRDSPVIAADDLISELRKAFDHWARESEVWKLSESR